MKKLVEAIERIIDPPVDPRIGEEAESFKVQVDVRAGQMRLVLKDIAGNALAHYDCSADAAYDLGEKIMRAYDRLEGL